MSRAFINTKGVKERLDKELKALAKIDPDIVKSFQIVEDNDKYFAAAARLVRHAAVDTAEIVKMLKDCPNHRDYVALLIGAMTKGNTKVEVPLFTYKRQTFYIYPGLKVTSPGNWTLLATVCAFSMQWLLDPWVKEVKEGLSDSKKKEGFVPFHRALKKLKRRNEITPQKLVQLLFSTFAPTNKVSDATIRDIGTYLGQCVIPPEVIFCNSPADYLNMYETGPASCMQGTTNRPWGHVFKEYSKNGSDLIGHPCVFYHYCPTTQGVYIRERGKVTARVILYGKPGEQRVGRLYASNTQAQTKLVQALRDKGIKGDPTRTAFVIPCSFEMPVFTTNEGCYVMIPYFDNLAGDGLIMRPKAGDCDLAEVRILGSGEGFAPKEGWKRYETNRAEGAHVFNPAKTCCEVCDLDISKKMKGYMRIPGDGPARFVCSSKCAQKFDLVFAKDQNQNIRLMPKDEAVIDWFNMENNYTTLQAGIRNGLAQTLFDSSHMEEDEEIMSAVDRIAIYNDNLNPEFFLGNQPTFSTVPSRYVVVDKDGNPVRQLNDAALRGANTLHQQLSKYNYTLPVPFQKLIAWHVKPSVEFDSEDVPYAAILAEFGLKRGVSSNEEEVEPVGIKKVPESELSEIDALFAKAKTNADVSRVV